VEIGEKCVCRMESGRKLVLILVVDNINGEFVAQVTLGLNGAA
jgi:hypothetical protein